jgi:hypothetical protein
MDGNVNRPPAKKPLHLQLLLWLSSFAEGGGSAFAVSAAFAVAVAVEIERGFSSASSRPQSGLRSAPSIVEGPGAKPEGEAADSIAFVVVFFPHFRPKIACQAPKPTNSLKQKEIHLAY